MNTTDHEWDWFWDGVFFGIVIAYVLGLLVF
jgi:hypothetical protein